MKIVQSFWTLPILNGSKTIFNNRFSGGWMDPKYHLMSWAYSCLQLRRFYKEVELVTDSPGRSLLIDQLQLPYTRVDLTLDSLDQHNPELWVIGKILAFGRQDAPFIHVDGDVFIWRKFPERLEKGELIAQNVEDSFPIYGEVMDWLRENNFYIPPVILDSSRDGIPLNAYNAGIIGGNDIPFIKEFVREFMRFVEENRSILSSISSGLVNAFCEQHLYYCMARKRGVRVECYTDSIDRDELDYTLKSLQKFRNAPEDTGYIHLFGEDTKKNRVICEELAGRLKKEYPVYYERVLSIMDCVPQ